eukprot:gene25232-biopygen13573
MNIDVVRRLAAAETAEGLLELIKQCLHRGDVLADTSVRAAWAALHAARPSESVSSEQWQLDHDAAVRLLETGCDPREPVRMHCEVQVVTAATAGIRHRMHEAYKVVRASSGAQLHADVAKPEEEEAMDDAFVREMGVGKALWTAAQYGRVATVKRLLMKGGGDGGGGDEDGSSTVVADVNWQNEEAAGMTAIYMAAQNGYLPVVMLLVAYNADVNQARTDTGATPVYTAAEEGHVDVVTALVASNADVNQARTDDGATPVFMAAQNGHVDVVKALVVGNADVNQAITTDGRTPVFMAAQQGHVDVVTALVASNADVNQATTDNGFTPVHIAAHQGHVDVVTALVASNA